VDRAFPGSAHASRAVVGTSADDLFPARGAPVRLRSEQAPTARQGACPLQNHSRKVSDANFGMFRCGAMPPSAFAIALNGGVCVKKFTMFGASDASRANQ